MQLQCKKIEVKKRYPLRISRGVSTHNHNLWVFLSSGVHTPEGGQGIGEMAPGGGVYDCSNDDALTEIMRWWSDNRESFEAGVSNKDVSTILTPSCRAAVDIALWDLRAKEVKLPLWRYMGLLPVMPETSVTVGIETPELQAERLMEILQRTGAKAVKLKLGSAEGLEADKASYSAVNETIRNVSRTKERSIAIRVDANGGWSLTDSLHMCDWLAERGVEFVEQPLARGAENELIELFEKRKLPIFLDESCQEAKDVPSIADRCDGVVVKLMKCGGITGALRLVAVADAFGLSKMIGCMGETSISIAAAAQLGSLFDYIDLDSHLNLDSDPATGILCNAGLLRLHNGFGHGASIV